MAHAVSALKPGGLVFIHEFILNNDKTGPLIVALFAINMLLGTPKGRAYSKHVNCGTHLRQGGIHEINACDSIKM